MYDQWILNKDAKNVQCGKRKVFSINDIEKTGNAHIEKLNWTSSCTKYKYHER
jgi:hypothetical protein